jgi:hypothetical protein
MAKKQKTGSPLSVPFKKQQAFASKLALLMNEAGEVGLYKTMHQIHEAVRIVGYELEYLMKKRKIGS